MTALAARFKGLGVISGEELPPPPAVAPAAVAAAPPIPNSFVEMGYDVCLRALNGLHGKGGRMREFYPRQVPDVEAYLSRVGKSIREGAIALGFQKQADALKALEARADLLASRMVPVAEFDKAVLEFERYMRALLTTMNNALQSGQGSLL